MKNSKCFLLVLAFMAVGYCVPARAGFSELAGGAGSRESDVTFFIMALLPLTGVITMVLPGKVKWVGALFAFLAVAAVFGGRLFYNA